MKNSTRFLSYLSMHLLEKFEEVNPSAHQARERLCEAFAEILDAVCVTHTEEGHIAPPLQKEDYALAKAMIQEAFEEALA